MFCKNCGAKLGDNVKFCPTCGASVSQEEPITTAYVSTDLQGSKTSRLHTIPSNKKKVKSIVAALSFTVVIIIGIAIIWKISPQNEKPDINIVSTLEKIITSFKEKLDKITDDESSRAAAYSEVISSLQEKYGVGSYSQEGEPSGLVVVREIDFDKDGIPELLCAFRNTNPVGGCWTIESPYCDGTQCTMCYEVWGWQNGQATRLVHAPILGSMAVDDFVITLREQNGKIYMLQGDGYVTAGVSIASTIQNNQWEEIAHLYCITYYEDPFDSDGNLKSSCFFYYNQGEQITEDEFDAISSKWFNYEDDEVQVIPMWYGNGHLSQTDQTIQCLKNGAVKGLP